jgi:hypothetical protein
VIVKSQKLTDRRAFQKRCHCYDRILIRTTNALVNETLSIRSSCRSVALS